MSIEIKQMVIKSKIFEEQNHHSEPENFDGDKVQKIIVSELNRSIQKLVTQKRER